jgi:hypothetical protein
MKVETSWRREGSWYLAVAPLPDPGFAFLDFR